MSKKGSRLLPPHLLTIEPLEDRLLLTGWDAAAATAAAAPALDSKTASSANWQPEKPAAATTSYATADAGQPDAMASGPATPQQSDSDAATYQDPSAPVASPATPPAGNPANYSTATYAESGRPQTGAVYYPTSQKVASATTPAQQQAAVQVAQAYEQYCMILANAEAAAKTPVEGQRASEPTAGAAERAAAQVRAPESSVQAAALRMADLPPPASTTASEATRRGPEANLLVPHPEMTEGSGAAPADALATVSQPEERGTLPPLGELLAGRVPLDLPGLRQSVQLFFEHLANLGEDSAAGPMDFRLAPWFVAVTLATSACEIARRQMRKQLGPGSISGLDPASRTWTWFPDPSGPPRGEVA
jgi:hypothetical protein